MRHAATSRAIAACRAATSRSAYFGSVHMLITVPSLLVVLKYAKVILHTLPSEMI
jgi:hypothetical protein